MTAQHTPGPWEVRDGGIYSTTARPDWAEGLDDYETERVQVICTIGACGGNDTAADLALIAAAPAMLAALRLALPHISQEVEDRKFGGNDEAWTGLEEVERSIMSAIATATGKRICNPDGYHATPEAAAMVERYNERPSGETEAASPTEETEGEAVENCTDAAAMVRDGLQLLETVDYVDDSALDDGQLFVVPAEGHGFRVNVRMWER